MSEAPKDTKAGLTGLDAEIAALTERARRGLPERARALREATHALRAGDAEAAAELRRLAHRLHGTAGSYGMAALGKEAAQVEALATEASVDGLAEAALALARSCEAEAGDYGAEDEGSLSNGVEDTRSEPADAAPDAANARHEEAPAAARVRALVVDDDPAIGRLVGILLERMGDYEVDVVDSPRWRSWTPGCVRRCWWSTP